MVTARAWVACFLLCHVSGVVTQDNFNGFLSKLPKYSLVQPQRIDNVQNSSDEFISYAIEINGEKHRIHLQKNRGFLHPRLFSDDASTKVPVHCYYHGEVEGLDDSMVAVSTCHGLRGVVLLQDEAFALEPLPGSQQLVLYRLSDAQQAAGGCGVPDPEGRPGRSHSLTSLLRRKRNLATISFVELALIVDNQRFNFKKRNETAVRQEMVETANLVDGYYKRLNIRVSLVHLEIFKDSNPFSVEGVAGEVLGRFVKWRKENLLPRVRNDVGQLVIGRSGSFDGGVMGMAFVGTICSSATSGGINVFTDTATVRYFSSIVAHEIGHNLGMNHDGDRCSCDGGCIMGQGGATFSTCSADDFEKLVLRGGGECLKNVPSHSDLVGVAECGNGLLEDGEQCDCGTPQECKDKCCDAAICRFSKGSTCAAGRCCQDCQLKVAGSPCRRSENSCDLPEFCTGDSAFCPDDFYLMDGLQCLSGAAYCYEGRCQTYDYQCRQLFSPDPAKKAADICFQTANIKGNAYGNCGKTSSGGFIKCSTANVLCGKLQCTNVDANRPPAGGSISNQEVNGSKCVNADFDLGPDVLDPGYSKPGSPCAPGMTCVDFKCVDAAVLLPKLDCDAKTTCNGRGVCNNMGHCHCDVGRAPPDCASSGRGGSVDSGPASIDYSLRNGLLIFFLLVVPVLVVGVLLFLFLFRRDSLGPCLKRRHKSRSTTNGAAPPQTRAPPPAHTLTPPPEPPTERPGPPPHPGGPGWSYGELDYWNAKDDPVQTPSGPQARPPPPPVPRQGPGAPRPIPPRPPKTDP